MTKETLEKIKKLNLWGMARTYETSLENEKLLALSADELIGMLVEAEWDDRQNRNLERRLRNARFRYQSSIESIDYQLTATWTGDSCCALPNAASSANMRTL